MDGFFVCKLQKLKDGPRLPGKVEQKINEAKRQIKELKKAGKPIPEELTKIITPPKKEKKPKVEAKPKYAFSLKTGKRSLVKKDKWRPVKRNSSKNNTV